MNTGFAARLAERVADLWNGRVPLGRAFWEYAVIYGSLANLATTILSLAAFASGWPAAVGLTLHFLATPYNLLMIVAVWRSAAHYAGHAIWATLARALVIVWAVVATAA